MAEFAGSYFSLKTLPPDGKPEIAILGRSNVGKSSLINALGKSKTLAKVSSLPGKTQSFNYYDFGKYYLVDLPGYGYARRSKEDRAKWMEMFDKYFESREALKGVLLLIDARHPRLETDMTTLEWIVSSGKTYVVVLTKTDKVNQSELARHIGILEQTGIAKGHIVGISSVSGKGLRQLADKVDSIFL